MKIAIVMAGVLLVIPNPARLPEQAAPADELQKVVEDYARLYTGPTLGGRALFHPAMIAVHPAEDGSIRVRNFDEFFGAQKRAFAAGSKMNKRWRTSGLNRAAWLDSAPISSSRMMGSHTAASWAFTLPKAARDGRSLPLFFPTTNRKAEQEGDCAQRQEC